MKTPTIHLQPLATHQITFHDTSGKARALNLRGDGQVEDQLLESLSRDGAVPKESFVTSLEDMRLNGADPLADLSKSGWRLDYQAGYKPNGFTMFLKDGDGPLKQVISVETTAQGGRISNLSSQADGVEHELTGESRNGKLNPDSVKESVVIDASPAGLPVYQDGTILFDLPSAFTGGCTF